MRSRAGEQGLDTGRIAELLQAGRERLVRGLAMRGCVDEQALGARLVGAEGLTERSNTFDERAEPAQIHELLPLSRESRRLRTDGRVILLALVFTSGRRALEAMYGKLGHPRSWGQADRAVSLVDEL